MNENAPPARIFLFSLSLPYNVCTEGTFMQQMKYSAAEEQTLMTRLWSPVIKDDPEAFVRFAFPWGEAGTPLERYKGCLLYTSDAADE